MNLGAKEAIRNGKAGEYLTCADLLLNGYNAFMVDNALPYDIVVECNNKLFKVQVKSTNKSRFNTSSKHVMKTPSYLFSMGTCGNLRDKTYSEHDVDIFAFVALDIKTIAYIPFANRRGHICFRIPELRGQYRNEKWMLYEKDILKLRNEGWTQKRIADKLKIHPTRVNQIEHGTYRKRGKCSGFYFDNFGLQKCLDFISNNKIKKSLLDEYLIK